MRCPKRHQLSPRPLELRRSRASALRSSPSTTAEGPAVLRVVMMMRRRLTTSCN